MSETAAVRAPGTGSAPTGSGTATSAILLAATPDPEHTAHALLAALAAEHVAALLPELGEQRIRAGLIRLARSATQLPSP